MIALLAPLALLSSLSLPTVQSTRLVRGAQLPGLSTRYWAVEDTSLDASEPNKNFGGSPFLPAGPGKTVLIAFKDLNRALGPGVKVRSAALILTVAVGNAPGLRTASKVAVPWGEGPIAPLFPWLRTPGATGEGAAEAPGESIYLAATWKHCRAGEGAIPWQVAGAMGPADAAPIPGATSRSEGLGAIRIEGLGEAVQEQLSRPLDNFGFALTFDAPAEFFSSQAPGNRPVLEVELEAAPPPQGADLSVQWIRREPEYERFAPPQRRTVLQDGVEIPLPGLAPNSQSKHLPSPGEELTYTALVKNVGNAESRGFSARWIVHERPGAATEFSRGLAPGESTEIVIRLPYRALASDHRGQGLALRVDPLGPDALTANNQLLIHEGALSVAAVFEKSAYERLARARNALGSTDPADWLQFQIAALNNVFFAQSRFSFARDGVLERVRMQRVEVVPDGALTARVPDLRVDAEWRFPAASEFSAVDFDRPHLRALLSELGLPVFDASSLSPADGRLDAALRIADGGEPVNYGCPDRFPGIMGFGDTRNETAFVPRQPLPYEPVLDRTLEAAQLEATDLLSAFDVGALNSNTGKRVCWRGEAVYDFPILTFLRVMDGNGRPLAGAKIEFHQMAAGVLTTGSPIAVATADASGVALLPKRAAPSFEPASTSNGHTLKPTIFGAISPTLDNGVLAVKVTKGQASDWAFLKAWQIVEASRRNPPGPVFLDLRANVADGVVDTGVDHAKGRIVTDSQKRLPAALSALVDGDLATVSALPSDDTGWIEIDLGRDRLVGEIRIVAGARPFWSQFEIVAYGTGQGPEEAFAWASEADWAWSVRNRASVDSGGARSVAYRAQARRIRFIRFVRKGGPTVGEAAEIQVFPLLPPP